jgi:hypothetical protein
MRFLLANLISLATFSHAIAGCFWHHPHGDAHESSTADAGICPIVAGPHVHWDEDHRSPSDHRHEHESDCHGMKCAGLANNQRGPIQLESGLAAFIEPAIAAAPLTDLAHMCALRPPDAPIERGVPLHLLHRVLVV